MSVPTFPEKATQLPLNNLARARHRQGVAAHIDTMRAFVSSNPLLTEGYEIGYIDLGARFRDDDPRATLTDPPQVNRLDAEAIVEQQQATIYLHAVKLAYH